MATETKSREAFIPFTGFYESTHGECIDNEVTSLLEERQDKTYEDLSIDYEGFKAEYAEQYVDAFVAYMSEEHGIGVTAKFIEVQSPKEYNFETDRILVEIDEDSLIAILAKVDFQKLRKEVFETLENRDGFFTIRDNNLSSWLFRGVHSWDTVEAGLLLDHFINFTEIDSPLEPDNAHEIAGEFLSWRGEVKKKKAHHSLHRNTGGGRKMLVSFASNLITYRWIQV